MHVCGSLVLQPVEGLQCFSRRAIGPFKLQLDVSQSVLHGGGSLLDVSVHCLQTAHRVLDRITQIHVAPPVAACVQIGSLPTTCLPKQPIRLQLLQANSANDNI